MDENVIEKNVLMVELTLRNDKYRGIVIEKFSTPSDEYFFKYGDQPIHRHCEQIQKVVRDANVKRTKKVRVDIAEFQFEYIRENVVTFKGCPLNSVGKQMLKVCDMQVNKQIGTIKRKITIEQNKQRKISEANDRIESNLQAMGQRYQEMLDERMQKLFGPPPTASQRTVSQNPAAPLPHHSRTNQAPVVSVAPQRHMQDQEEQNDEDINMSLPSDNSDF